MGRIHVFAARNTPLQVPNDLPDEVAAMTEVTSVTHGFDRARLLTAGWGGSAFGESVAVVGVGPLGFCHLVKARLMGCGKLIAIDRLESRLALARRFGATLTINAEQTDEKERVALIREHTHTGADIVIDCTGIAQSFPECLHLVRYGGTVVEAGTLRWALREQETNLVASAPLWAHLVDLECRRDIAAADEAASRLESIAGSLASPGIRALARLSRGRVLTARGEDSVATLQGALRELGEDERPRLRAEIHIALAEAEQGTDVAAATTHARAGLAIFERLGARRDADRAAALLRSLGVSVRAGADAAGRRGLEMLSRREREVVPLLAEGLSNAEIAKQLFITPKTVEHHVTNILGRLGLRTRTEVAAWAHRGSSSG